MQQRFLLQILLLAGQITLSSTPNQQLENHSTKCHGEQLFYNTLELLMMGIVVHETCWASSKICNKNLCCIRLAFYFHIFYVFISMIYMFRATSCSSSGESIESVQHLVYVTLCMWPFGVQVSDLHTKRSPTQSDIYQVLYWHNWFSWWWARGCSKHVHHRNKHI